MNGSRQQQLHLLLTLGLAVLLQAGCGEDDVLRVAPVPSPEPAVFVVNSLGETLSRILIERGTVVQDALALGSAPNAIVVDPGGELGLVVNSGNNRIDLIDLDQLIIRRSIDLGPGSSPFRLVLVDGEAYVSNFAANDVARVDLEAGLVVRRIPVGHGPEGLLFVPDEGGGGGQGDLYVATTGYTSSGYGPGEVFVLSVPADTVRSRIIVGTNPQDLARAPDGTIHVVCTGDYATREGRVFVIDPELGTVVDSLEIGGAPAALLVLEDGQGITVGYSGGLRHYGRAGGPAAEARALPGEVGLSALVHDPVENRLYLSDFDDSLVHVVDVASDSLVSSYVTGHGPVHLALRR
jgi:DNA-binding beta-propeller fold protein YncE